MRKKAVSLVARSFFLLSHFSLISLGPLSGNGSICISAASTLLPARRYVHTTTVQRMCVPVLMASGDTGESGGKKTWHNRSLSGF